MYDLQIPTKFSVFLLLPRVEGVAITSFQLQLLRYFYCLPSELSNMNRCGKTITGEIWKGTINP